MTILNPKTMLHKTIKREDYTFEEFFKIFWFYFTKTDYIIFTN